MYEKLLNILTAVHTKSLNIRDVQVTTVGCAYMYSSTGMVNLSRFHSCGRVVPTSVDRMVVHQLDRRSFVYRFVAQMNGDRFIHTLRHLCAFRLTFY